MANFVGADYIIFAIFLFSTCAGLFRGLVKEVLTIFTWIGASIISVLFSGQVAALFTASEAGRSVISETTSAIGTNTSDSVSIVSLGISFVSLFLITLIIGSLISSFVNKAVEGAGIGVANRLFGGAFGFLRGFLVNLVLVFVVLLTPLDKESWWTEATLVPAFRPAAAWLGDLVHPGLESLKNTFGQTIQDAKSTIDNVYEYRG